MVQCGVERPVRGKGERDEGNVACPTPIAPGGWRWPATANPRSWAPCSKRCTRSCGAWPTRACTATSRRSRRPCWCTSCSCASPRARSEEHTSELQSLMRISYAVFCLKKKKLQRQHQIKLYAKITKHILLYK